MCYCTQMQGELIMAYIYIIENDINNNKYVGQTSHTIEYRWNLHKRDYVYFNYPLYNAFKKYGLEHFSIRQLEECNEDIVQEREKYWINIYNSYKNGYNATLGGEGCPKYNYDEIMSLWKEGYTIKYISLKLGAHPDIIGKILRDLGITKQEIFHRVGGSNRKLVAQYSLTNELIKIYPSATEAARQVKNQNAQSNISLCCRGKCKTAYGYKWRYVEEEYEGQKYEILKEYNV